MTVTRNRPAEVQWNKKSPQWNYTCLNCPLCSLHRGYFYRLEQGGAINYAKSKNLRYKKGSCSCSGS